MYNTVPISGLHAILWTLTSVATLLSIGRFAIRYANKKRLLWDDVSHLLSLVFLICLAIAYTAKGFRYSQRIARIQMKKEKAPPLNDAFYREYLQCRVAVTLLVFFVLWTVKATFLILYRILFDVSRTFLRMWWVVVGLTFASFWVCIGTTLTLCGSASDLYTFRRRFFPEWYSYFPKLNVTEKCSSPTTQHAVRATYKYWCALNVLTDLAVMALPIYMLLGLQMRKGQKAGLAGVFCLGLVVVVFDILRTVESLVSGTFSGVALWSSMEVSVAVVVASLPPYRRMLGNKTRKDTVRYLSWDRYEQFDKNNSQKASAGFDNARSHPNGAFSSADDGALELHKSASSRKGASALSPAPPAHFDASS